MSSLLIRKNYLLKDNGCKIIEVSNEREGSGAGNILVNNERNLWIVERSLPQHCTIDTSTLTNSPLTFNCIGFYCWHEYESNPALIEVAYASPGQEWKVAAKVRLKKASDRQYFRIKEIPAAQMKQLRISLLENFGDPFTYLNQVELGFEQEAASQQPVQPNRDKIFSEFMKLTSTEKQLKKAQEQIKRLSLENQEIKKTLLRQGETILEMQNALRMVTKELEKLQEMQLTQSQQFFADNSKHQIEKIIEKKMKNKLKLDTNSSQNSSQPERKYIEDKLIKKNTLPLNNKNSIYPNTHHRSSAQKSKEFIVESTNKAKRGKRNMDTFLIKSRSSSGLSDYMVSERENNRSKYSEMCCEMMSKLQFLLAEREKRSIELRKRNPSINNS